MVAALVLLSAVIPLMLRGMRMRKRSLAEPHAENNGNNTLTRTADLNQVSSIGDCDVQFARDAVLSSKKFKSNLLYNLYHILHKFLKLTFVRQKKTKPEILRLSSLSKQTLA